MPSAPSIILYLKILRFCYLFCLFVYFIFYYVFKIWNRLFHISISFSNDCKPAAYFNGFDLLQITPPFKKFCFGRSLNSGCQLQSESSCEVGWALASPTEHEAQPCRWWLHWALPVSGAGRCPQYSSSAGAQTRNDPAESTSNAVGARFRCSDFVS